MFQPIIVSSSDDDNLDIGILERQLDKLRQQEAEGIAYIASPIIANYLLRNAWEHNLDLHAYLQEERRTSEAKFREHLNAAKARDEKIKFSRVKNFTDQKEWRLSFSEEFTFNVGKIDRKMQGRILEAITDILTSPQTLRGDTIKPLTGNLKGLWRYRIGDFRLIYAADIQTKLVRLLNFGTRGEIYT